MATGNRTLKLSILADVDDLKKKLGEADKVVEGNSSKISEFGKKAAAAFAVAAAAAVAYAGKLAVDGVKAAIEDEQAQLRLAAALRTATGATDGQIKATEDYISKTALAVGIADDKLRPAFQRLAVSTKDTAQAQKLLSLAIDVSQGSGKDLETVVNALGKAQDGNTTSLGRLGVGLSRAELSTLSFTDIQTKLSDLYGGAAARNAETFQGRIDRLRVGFDEAKEAVGVALLPIIERLIEFIFVYGAPIVDKFRNAFDVIRKAIENNRDEFTEFWLLLKDKVFPILQTVFGFLLDVGAKAASAIINAFGAIVGAITPVLNFLIDAINVVIKGLNLVKSGSDIQQIGKVGSSGSSSSGGFSGIPSGGSVSTSGGGFSFSGGGTSGGGIGGTGGGIGGAAGVLGATSAADLVNRLTKVNDAFTDLTFQVATGGISKSAAQKQFDKLTQEFATLERQGNALVSQNPSGLRDLAAAQGTNIYISGSIDPEGTARAVSKAVNESAARSTGSIDFYAVRQKAG
jgi:uncharacterized membrane protein YgcG